MKSLLFLAIILAGHLNIAHGQSRDDRQRSIDSLDRLIKQGDALMDSLFRADSLNQISNLNASVAKAVAVARQEVLNVSDSLRRIYLGKDLWLTNRYATIVSHTPPQSEMQFLEHCTITSIDTSNDYSRLAISLTNDSGRIFIVEANWRKYGLSVIEHGFTFTSAKKDHPKWSKKVWSAIEEGSVFVGMTPDQAELSWGPPDHINTTTTRSGQTAQWVYSKGAYLYFDGNKLTTIQH